MSEHLPVSFMTKLLFGDNMELDDSADLDEQPNPFEKMKHDGAVRAMLGKSQDVSCVLDLSLPSDDGVDGDEPLYRSPRIVHGARTALAQTGDAKFIKLLAVIRRVFASDDELMNEAIETVTKARNEERNAMLAQIAAAQ